MLGGSGNNSLGSPIEERNEFWGLEGGRGGNVEREIPQEGGNLQGRLERQKEQVRSFKKAEN